MRSGRNLKIKENSLWLWEGVVMRCPGVYPPDPTLGITDPQIPPPPKLVSRSRNYEHRPCPLCGSSCPRDWIFTRTLHDLGDPVAGRPHDLRLTDSQHHGTRCRRFRTAEMSYWAAPRARYSHRVVAQAVRLVVEDGLPDQAASWHPCADHRVFVPFSATIQNGVEAREKGGPPHRGRTPRAVHSRLRPGLPAGHRPHAPDSQRERLDTLPALEDRSLQAHRLAVHGCDRLVAHRGRTCPTACAGPLDPGGSDLTLTLLRKPDLQPQEPSLSSLPGAGPGTSRTAFVLRYPP